MWETIIVTPFTNALLFIYKLIGGNFGVAIILFTILIRLITHPLMASQIKGSTKMQEMQNSKEWQDIQKKYKDDKEKLAQEQMRYYKEIGYNPFSSCLPSLIQIPIIFGLYQSIMRALAASPAQLLILTRTVYSFFHIGGLVPLNSRFLWMNLGQPERVYMFGYGIPVLAIIVAITTYIQSKVTMPPSTNPNDQSAMMGKMMAIYMPLLLGYFALTFASGLSVYFITGNVVGIAQYALLGKVNWRALLPGQKPAPALATRKK
ncbi:MAG TPA: YidC/Oxa1 family membrane protein insertase [Anaerolineales bacterium]|nr:YidC/Oxa1 family membrane protein insertase [Anaerolineales bacterium]